MGQIRRRFNTYYIRYYRSGRRYEESTHSSRKQDAIDLLRLREGDIAKGVPVTPKIGQLRFEEAVADVVTDYRINGKRSVADVERRIRLHLEPFFGHRRVSTITTAHVRDYIASRQQQDAKNATINRELAIVKRGFALAAQANKALHRPFIPMLHEDNVRTGFFERAEFDAVRDHLPVGVRPVVTFAYFTGWRIHSEVLTLQWRMIDRRAGVVRLDTGSTKNRDGRVFPYADLLHELGDAIDSQWTVHETLRARGVLTPWVFPRAQGPDPGRPIRSFRDAWTRSCRTAGQPGKVPHDFRRTAVRNLTRAGVPERVAMMLTGHKTRSVFDRYDIVNEQDLRDAVRKLGRAAGAEKGAVGRSGVIQPIGSSS